MKQKLFVLISLPLVILASACGKSEDQPAPATVAAVGVTCPAGQVNYNNTCVNAQYGQQPPVCNGNQNCGYQQPPSGYPSCGGQYWNNGYSYQQNNCWGYYGGYHYTRWYYYGGVIWYW